MWKNMCNDVRGHEKQPLDSKDGTLCSFLQDYPPPPPPAAPFLLQLKHLNLGKAQKKQLFIRIPASGVLRNGGFQSLNLTFLVKYGF